MSHEGALEWIATLVEASVGLYVFLITIPALVYSTFAPEEIKKLQHNKVGGFSDRDYFGLFITFLIFAIVAVASFHFYWLEMVHLHTEAEDVRGCTCPECAFSLCCTLLTTFLFVVLLGSGARFYLRKSRMTGHFEKALEATKTNLLHCFLPTLKITPRPWHYRVADALLAGPPSVYNHPNRIDIFWSELELLGRHASTGRQKKLWIKAIGEVIFHLADSDTKLENLKKAVAILGEIVGEDTETASHDNIKDTINIYRTLLSKLRRKESYSQEVDRFSECYEEMANHILNFFRITLYHDDVQLLPTIVSTVTLFPNSSFTLFEICVEALKKDKYEILVYAFNEIVDTNNLKAAWIHNFWGIYAALYMKGGAFQEYAEQIRRNTGIRKPRKGTLNAAYKHHFECANFNIANILHDLIDGYDETPG